MRDLGYFGRSVRQQNQKANKSGLGWPRFAPAAAGLRQRLPSSSSTSSSSHLLLLLSQCQPCPVPAMVVRWWEQSLHLNPTVSGQRQTLSPLCCVDPPAHGIPLWGSQPTPSLHRDLSPPCPGPAWPPARCHKKPWEPQDHPKFLHRAPTEGLWLGMS